ncbi:hypothetical protein IE989_05265 [Klebsiella pneumoniae]|nr:hypothetical protein [Klebsiella pneumoniae]
MTTGCCCISRCSWTNNAKTWRQKNAGQRRAIPGLGRCMLSGVDRDHQPGRWQRAAGMLLLTGELFQIGFDFADLIGDHAFQMA